MRDRRANSSPAVELPKPSWSTLHAESWQNQHRRSLPAPGEENVSMPSYSQSQTYSSMHVTNTASREHQFSNASAASPSAQPSLNPSLNPYAEVAHSPSPPWSPLGSSRSPQRNRSGSPAFGGHVRPQVPTFKNLALPEMPEPDMPSPKGTGSALPSGRVPKSNGAVLELMNHALTHCGSMPILAASTKHLQALLKRLPT